jgi:murein DD-endopeptidase MepM/ murein hydrolase activator NlpD
LFRIIYIFLIIISFCIFSCSGIKSGHYVQIKNGDSIESLSIEFGISKEKIIEFNSGKSITAGEWIFIPLKRGILSQNHDTKALDPKLLIGTGNFAWPVPSSTIITSGFGQRWGRAHEGIDIAGKVGSHIVSSADGVVVYSGSEIGGYGNITVIAHKNGFFSIYAHAKTNFTRPGQRVYKGQVISQIGMTGRTTGPHLHFEIRKNGEAIDPSSFLATNN